MSYFLVRSFSLLAQRKRTKRKGSRSLGPAIRDCPALLETTGSLKLASLRQLNSCFGRFCGARRCESAKIKKHSSSFCDLLAFNQVKTGVDARSSEVGYIIICPPRRDDEYASVSAWFRVCFPLPQDPQVRSGRG